MQQLFDTVRTTHPDAAITRAEIPRSSSQAVLFKLKRRADQAPILAAIDPYRGRIVRDGGLSAWPVEWLFLVNAQLLSGPAGDCNRVIAVILLFAISAPGPWFCGPGRKSLQE